MPTSLTSAQLELLKLWEPNIFIENTLAEIMQITHRKSKPWIFTAMKNLVHSHLVLLETRGNQGFYKLNLENPFSFQLLHALTIKQQLNFPHHSLLSEIITKIPVKNAGILVFGSYAEKKQKETSDLDICFLIGTKEAELEILPYMNDIKLNHRIEIDAHYVTLGDFKGMLLRPEENMGKQIFRKHLLFYNPDIYYQLIKEAYLHGFRP